jgi:MarR family 2-MHQ and catechol resistance regulon transcriptional repressor
MPPDGPTLGLGLGTALQFWSVLSRAHAIVAERVARAAARFDLTQAEHAALDALGRHGPMLLGELQQEILVSSGGVTYLIDRLATRGLVARRPNPDDRRARFAALTEQGQQLLDQLAPEHERAVADAVDGLTRREQRHVADLLRKLGLRLDEEPRGEPAPTAERETPPREMRESSPARPVDTAVARILVVDDDDRTIEAARAALETSGREVLTVRTAAAAEALLKTQDISLILLGLALPDADGRNVYATLSRRTSTAGIPVVMVSTAVGEQAKAECLGLGVAGWLDKPIDPVALATVAAAALSRTTVPGLAHTDPVSGAASRARITEAYQRDVRSQSGDAPSASLALLDWDDLGAINDALGTEAGDAILRQAHVRLTGVLRDEDTLARWREDEFVALFPRTDPSTAARLLTKAQAALAATPPVTADGREVPITFSAGITTAATVTVLDEAVAAADSALSRAKAGGPSRVVTAGDGTAATPIRALVAEDDRVTATLVRHRLQRAGFDVVHCDNGVDALAAAETGDFGLCISDIRMPGLDGFELLRRLRAMPRYHATPILMLTSLGREEDIGRAFTLGASDYMTKPFSPVELLARVRRLLRRRVSAAGS